MIREHIPTEQYDFSHATRLEVGPQRSNEASPDIVMVSMLAADGRPAPVAVRAAYPTATIIALVPLEDQALGERALADGADDYHVP
jgi:DNA-binding response OmpR family regulator